MAAMLVSLIAAVAENGVIGREGALPWRLSADLQRFKRLTMGHPIIMGRRTWESIGKPLPGRTSIVVTRQLEFLPASPEVLVAHTLDDAIAAAALSPGGDTEAFVIGGGELYAAALPRADRLYLTRVLATVEGDARFPAYDASPWRLLSSEYFSADAKNEFPHNYEVYERAP
jgi:dihydrofolate reductase